VSRSLFDLHTEDGRRLIGTVDEPDGPPRSVIVFGPSGLQSRAGANRASVTIARALAARGHRVVRADLGGIGESEGDLPEQHVSKHWEAIESGLFVPDYLAVLEHARESAGAAPVLGTGLCSGGITALLAGAERHWLAGVFAIGVPFIRANHQAPPGFARASMRRRAQQTLRRRGTDAGRHHVRRAARMFVTSLIPRRRPSIYDESANEWLNVPLAKAVLQLHREGRRVEMTYGAHDVALGQLEEVVLGPNGLAPTAAFTTTTYEDLGHQLDHPDEVERLIDAIDAWACQSAAVAAPVAA
jgi:hypothetical protein